MLLRITNKLFCYKSWSLYRL